MAGWNCQENGLMAGWNGNESESENAGMPRALIAEHRKEVKQHEYDDGNRAAANVDFVQGLLLSLLCLFVIGVRGLRGLLRGLPRGVRGSGRGVRRLRAVGRAGSGVGIVRTAGGDAVPIVPAVHVVRMTAARAQNERFVV